MATLVIDASVGIPLVWSEDFSPIARRNAARWLEGGTSLVVPAPFWTEVVNSLTKRHGLSGSTVLEALFELDQFGIETVDVDRPLLLAGLDLVERSGLTIHAAIYLALARSIEARLATFDRELIAAGGPDIVDLWADEGPQPHRLSEQRAPYGPAERPVTWPSWPGAGEYLASLRRQAIAGR